MNAWRKFNINDEVKIRLNESGQTALRDYYQPLYPPKPDVDGYITMQMWEVMEIFGPKMRIGFDPPFKPSICIPAEHGCGAETIKAALHHLDLMEPGNLAHQRAQVAHLLRSLLPEG